MVTRDFIKISVSLGWLLLFKSDLVAQKQLNFGLTRKQPVATIPKGKAAFQQAVLKQRSGIAGSLNPLGNDSYAINKGWELTDNMDHVIGSAAVFSDAIHSEGWSDAVVPGTVLTSLLAAGKYPDPYFGLNNLAITDSLCRRDWWYRTTFESPSTNKGKIAWLQFNGISYKSKVWLNGKYLGDINGAFTRGTFNVSNYLKKTGRNVLLVQILPPPNPGIPDEQSALSGMGRNGGQHTLDGPSFFPTEGWDWIPGIRDRNMGIWQDVQLYYTGTVTSDDPQIITDLPLPDTSFAMISLKTKLVNHSNLAQEATIQFSFEGVSVSQKISLKPGETLPVAMNSKQFQQLTIKNPKLWWPNGYGNPNLYYATLKVKDVNGWEEVKKVRFGIREYSYELLTDTKTQKNLRISYSPTDLQLGKPMFDYINRREHGNKIHVPTLHEGVPLNKLELLADTTNPYLVIKVNGQPVFSKGGNWGLDDAMKKINRENLEPAFQLHQKANFNMIRNWVGQNTEPVFFDLADEYGMMVWNDFWISTEGFNLNPLDESLLLANSLDVIKRYRNHASIVLWCPRNEGYAPLNIENDLAMQIATEDGTRHYHGNSREMNIRNSGPWHFFVNNKDYFLKHGKGFTSEIGTFSVPEASTIRKFIAPEDQWPINDVWHYHDLHVNNQNLEGYLRTTDSLYGPSKDLDDFNRKIQLVNYESHRAIFESWNANLWNNASGVLLWMSHPAWPSMIWQTYSWDFQTHGSYYGSKKGTEPLHVQLNLHDNKVVVANTSLKGVLQATVGYDLLSPSGKLLQNQSKQLDLLANAKTDVFDFVTDKITLPDNYLVRVWIKDSKGIELATNEYWKANESVGHFKSFNDISTVNLQATIVPLENGVVKIELENKSKQPAIGIKLDAMDAIDQIVLPSYFSDGYFTLLPKEKKVVYLEMGNKKGFAKIKIAGYNLNQILTFKK